MTVSYTIDDVRNLKRLMKSDEKQNHQIGALSMVALGIIPQEVFNCMDAYDNYKMAKIKFIANDDFEITIDISCPCDYKQTDVVNHIYKIQNLVGFSFFCDSIVMPPSLFQVQNLRELSASFNPNNGKEEELFQHLSELKKLEKLVLYSCKLDFLPSSIKNFKQLKSLRLEENNLEELPSGFVELENLEFLDIGTNKFKVFPKEIFELKNLKELNLNNLELNQIPDEILNLNQLEKLSIKKMKLASFPKIIFELPHLKEVEVLKDTYTEEEIHHAQNILGEGLKISEY